MTNCRNTGRLHSLFVVSFIVAMLLATSNVYAAVKPVEITFWFYVAGPNFENVKAMVNEFNEQNSDIKVNTTLVTDWSTKLPVAIAGGTPPDVVWMDWMSVGTYAAQGTLVNLEELMKRENKLATYSKDFYPPLWETSKVNGQVYALPFDTNNMLMYYNRDILNKSGIAEPADTWTWDDFVKMAKRISSPPDSYAFSAVNDWRHYIDLLGALNGRVFSPDGKRLTLNTPEGLEALQFMFDVMNTHQMAPPPEANTEFWRTGFANGHLAFEVQGSYRLPQYSTLGTTNLGAVAQPQRLARYSSAGGESVVVIKSTQAREAAAWRFIDWICSGSVNAKWSALSGYLPVRRTSMAHSLYQEILRNDPLRRRFAQELDYGDRLPTMPGSGQVFGILTNMVTRTVNRTVTPQQALADAEIKIKAALNLP